VGEILITRDQRAVIGVFGQMIWPHVNRN